MKPIDAQIIEIIEESPLIRTFKFNVSFDDVKPGQFVMVWIRGYDEIPMGCSYHNAITVQNVGKATAKLFEMKVGDSVGLRGPFGNGFTLPSTYEHVLIIAGGVGIAPLGLLADSVSQAHITTIIGAKTAAELVFKDRFLRAGDVHITTDDASEGTAGFVTTVLSEMNLEDYDRIYICGPEVMMINVLKIFDDKGISNRLELSLHRYFKCAIGVCGACCMDSTGFRVCKDGPVVNGTLLIDSEFGKYKRNASSQKIDI